MNKTIDNNIVEAEAPETPAAAASAQAEKQPKQQSPGIADALQQHSSDKGGSVYDSKQHGAIIIDQKKASDAPGSANATANTSPQPATGTGVKNELPSFSATVGSGQDEGGKKQKEKAPRTKGWWLFDFLNYFVVNWIVNIALSLIMAKAQYKYNTAASDDMEKKKKAGLEDFDVNKNPWRKGWNWFYNKANPGFDKAISQPLWNGVDHEKSHQFWKKVPLVKSWKGVANYLTLPEKWNVPLLPTKSEKGKVGGLGAGITTDVFLLSWGGTSLLMPIKWFEDSKPTTVRKFDNALDKVRGVFGGGPDEKELEERQKIYDRLDNELKTESVARLSWSRFWSVVGVIAAIFTFSFLDGKRDLRNGVATETPNEITVLQKMRRGVFWIREGVFRGALNLVRKNENAKNWPIIGNTLNVLSDSHHPDHDRKRNMVRMAITEVMGTTITSSVAYFYLKAKELFGLGKDKDGAEQKSEQATGSTATEPVMQATAEKAQAASAAQRMDETRDTAVDKNNKGSGQPQRKPYVETIRKEQSATEPAMAMV